MPKFSYVAMDSHGKESKGTLEVGSQNEAIGRVKEMGLFPTKIVEIDKEKPAAKADKKTAGGKQAKGAAKKKGGGGGNINIKIPGLSGRVKSKVLATFTRQLATLVDAGLPLLRGLRVLEKQEKNPTLKSIIAELALAIEGGSTFSEALAQHPKVFDRLYVNMVKAGELGGVLEVVLTRLAEFKEKAQKIKGKVLSAMIYPAIVMTMAVVIMGFLLVFIVPRFEAIFKDMLGDKPLPGITIFVITISRFAQSNWAMLIGAVVVLIIGIKILGRTSGGRSVIDQFKLRLPLFGDLICKTSI